MLILDLKNYVESRQQVSLVEISHHFHIPTSMVEDMLKTWVDKGIIAKQKMSIDNLPTCSQSKDCPRCQLKTNPESLTVFTYVNAH
ncbi:hypothetical protein GKC56_06670 [Neisseriaceae bacterium PsAf]|nr:hypothetical protein [Neisseriaceae bacterium PsAf]